VEEMDEEIEEVQKRRCLGLGWVSKNLFVVVVVVGLLMGYFVG
jgi:hypothetical protein